MQQIDRKKLEDLQLSGQKMLVDFYAVWCGPCKTLTPMLEGIENDYQNIKFYKFDVDTDMQYVTELGITSIPTIMIFDGKNIHDRSNGLKSITYYKEKLNEINE